MWSSEIPDTVIVGGKKYNIYNKGTLEVIISLLLKNSAGTTGHGKSHMY